jgi:hypothetical protein
LFRQAASTKQSQNGMKPFLATCEGCSKPAVAIQIRNNRRAVKAILKGAVMVKALSAILVAAFVAATLTILPGFAPQVSAGVPKPLAKSDRLDIRPIGPDCSQQAWPNFEASCLRRAGTKSTVREARMVSADRTQ